MPKRSREYMGAQRLRFCEAAMACFRRKGVVASSLTDVCEEAGLSMGALYKHFRSRDELLLAVLEIRLARRDEQLKGNDWPALRTAILDYRESADEDPFWHEFQGVVDWSEPLRAVRVREARVILTQLEQLLDRYVAAGEIAPAFDSLRTAQLLSVIVDGALLNVRSSPMLHISREDLSAYLDYAVNARPVQPAVAADPAFPEKSTI
jgi:AcrR family transcriptional regulator